MTNWLMAASIHSTDIHSHYVGTPWPYDVISNEKLRAGDLVYLVAGQSGLYGWGHITIVEPAQSKPSDQEMYRVIITRPVVREGIASMEEIERDENLAGIMSSLDGNFAELTPRQANALNRLLRRRQEPAPSDVDEYRDQIGNFGFRTMASFQAKLRRTVSDHQRASVFFLDLDNFKSVNDDYDHATGDAVIREALTIVQQTLGESGEVFHRSGDEFVVLVPALDHAQATEIAERVRGAIEGHPFPVIGRGRVTTTIGVATHPETCEKWEDLENLADATAMKAKKVRKNWVASPLSNFDIAPPVTDADLERDQLEIQRIDVL